MSELDRPEEPQDSDLSAPELGKPDGEPATWSQTDIDAVVTRTDLDAFYPKIDTSWIADLVPKLDAPHIAGLDALYPKIDTSWIADLVPKLDAPHIAGLDALYPKIDTSWIADLVPKLDAPHIAGLDALYPKIDTSWIADLVPKLDAPHIAGLDALYPKIDTSWIADLVPKLDAPWIAGLDALYPKIDTSWIADLVPKLDAPWIADLESILPRFDSSWFELLADVVRQRVRSFPPNWLTVSTVDVFDDDKLRSIVLDEGIPLAWVPGSSLIERLLAAQDAAHRRELIRNGWRGIVNDCVQAATGLPSRQGRTHARFITLGASAIRDGHYEAAQALAANLVDTLGNSYVKAAVAGYSWSIVTAKNLRPKLSALTMRTLMVLGPLAVGHTAFRPDDAIPRVFSRHATAHGVSRRQYTRVNSLIALMNATALLCWLERDCGAFSAE